MRVVNNSKNTVLADECRGANSFWERLIGLLNHKSIAMGDGLLLGHCFGIHTIGMRFAIDILALDADLRVLRIIKALPPGRACVFKRATFIMELPAGVLDRTQTMEGDQIHIHANNGTNLHAGKTF